jgi:Domain of unknown function (DUF4282)
MPDRSSHQGLPDDWGHGSHAARGPFSTGGASDGYGAGTAGSHRTRTTDGYSTGPTDALGAPGASGAPNTDALGAGADSYGVGKIDAFRARPADTYGAGKIDAFRARPADTYGAGAADPFGDADPFGPRTTADPFGPAATAAFAAAPSEAGTARPEAERPATAIGELAPGEAADPRGFLSALFDFGFTSFVTPKVIRVLYMLIVIGTVVSALVFTIIVFKASVTFGLFTLFFGDPLFILITLAIYRIILEFFAVTFRVAEDIRAMRERGDPR